MMSRETETDVYVIRIPAQLLGSRPAKEKYENRVKSTVTFSLRELGAVGGAKLSFHGKYVFPHEQ